MKRLAALLLMVLLLPVPACAGTLMDVDVWVEAEIPAPVAEGDCTMTLNLQDGVNTISRAGVYRVQGSCVGQLIINAKNTDVYLLLDGVQITSPDGPAIHVKAADKVVLTLAAGTETILTDSTVYTLPAGEDEPDGAIFSKADLMINGAGTLTVHAQYDDGIVSKDGLMLTDAQISVTSIGDAVRGKDSVLMSSVTLTVNAGKDGVKSTNNEEAERGWICIVNSDLNIVSKTDGIQAETDLYICGSEINITSGGGCLPEYRQEIAAPVRKADRAAQEESKDAVESEPDTESCKGMKARHIRIGGDTFVINSRDDAIHAGGNIDIFSGYFELASNDDGIHADDTFILHDGQLVIMESFEGIEAAHIELLGGDTDITAIDDGWNAASKAVAAADSGRRKKSHDYSITVSGGEHTILAGTDAIDSNGSILISGGVTLASSSNEMKEVPIDYPLVCECRMTGGVLAASGGYGKNMQTFNQVENQASVTLKWKEQQPAGTTVRLMVDDTEVLVLAPKAPFKSIIVSAPALQVGKVLTVQTGDEGHCSRTIEESIMFFPVTQSKRTGKTAQTSTTVQESQAPVSYGTMIEQPASGSSLGYLLYTPNGVKTEELPLIVYLHGGSGKGSDLSLMTAADGFPQYVQTGKLGDIRAYVLMPQCPEDQKGWREIANQVFELIDEVRGSYPIDQQRIILTGHSMGGTGTWALATMQPERFSCVVPMSGSVKITKKNQKALSKLSVWAFVAENDKVVSPDSSTDFVSQLTTVNPDARLTVFEGAGHRDVPTLAWLDEELGLLDWMLSK